MMTLSWLLLPCIMSPGRGSSISAGASASDIGESSGAEMSESETEHSGYTCPNLSHHFKANGEESIHNIILSHIRHKVFARIIFAIVTLFLKTAWESVLCRLCRKKCLHTYRFS